MSQDCKQWHDCGQGARPKQIQGLLDSGYLMPSIDACGLFVYSCATECGGSRHSCKCALTRKSKRFSRRLNPAATGPLLLLWKVPEPAGIRFQRQRVRTARCTCRTFTLSYSFSRAKQRPQSSFASTCATSPVCRKQHVSMSTCSPLTSAAGGPRPSTEESMQTPRSTRSAGPRPQHPLQLQRLRRWRPEKARSRR